MDTENAIEALSLFAEWAKREEEKAEGYMPQLMLYNDGSGRVLDMIQVPSDEEEMRRVVRVYNDGFGSLAELVQWLRKQE